MAAGGPLFVVDSEIDLLFSIFRLLGTPSEATWEGVTDLPCSIENFPNWLPKARLADIFSVLGDNGCDLLSRLLTYNNTQRISAMDALRHPFFTSHGLVWSPPSLDAVPPSMRRLLTETKCSVWATLCSREAEIPQLGDFLAPANADDPDEDRVLPDMRAILIDWLDEITFSYFMRAERRALHTAVGLLDRYLALTPVSKQQLQLVGSTCYSLAAKLEEAEVITSAGYVSISDNAFTEEEMRQCEVSVTDKLQCRIALPTVADFEPLIVETLALESGNEVWTESPMVLLAQMLGDAMLLRYPGADGHQHRPSVVCCSTFAVASLTVLKKLPLAVLTAADQSSYVRCVRDLYATVELIKQRDWNHVFANPKYVRVREMTLVDMDTCIAEIESAGYAR